ncbi:MAG: OmpA family protein [Saprospirales bacterium]|nr:OmpA family protein [Saprospirales bacterium]
MRNFNGLLFALFILFFLSACVSSKVYRAELSAREQCEAREQILVQEVLDRRKETTDLIKQAGELNRNLGSQDAEIRNLKIELTSRTQQMGESSTRLVSEKADLEREVAALTALIERRDATVQSISSAQKNRQSVLTDLKTALSRAYAGTAGMAVDIQDDAVVLTLPDAVLFDKNGVAISAAGRNLLQPLAGILSNRPELDAEILAFTDNALPKGIKNAGDTWDWSLLRAANVVRLLIREFNINANQLTPVGKGEFYPLSSNETADGRLKNRRTAVVIHPSLPKVPRVE